MSLLLQMAIATRFGEALTPSLPKPGVPFEPWSSFSGQISEECHVFAIARFRVWRTRPYLGTTLSIDGDHVCGQ